MDCVMITLNEYRDLLEGWHRLSALESGGVDNWEGYGWSLSIYCKEEDVKSIDELVQRSIDKMELINLGKEDDT